LVGVRLTCVKDRSLGETRVHDYLDFDHKNPPTIVRRLHVDTDKLIRLKILVPERIEVLDRDDWARQLQNGIEQADQANLIARFAEDLAKREINPSSNSNLH